MRPLVVEAAQKNYVALLPLDKLDGREQSILRPHQNLLISQYKNLPAVGIVPARPQG